MNADLLQIEWFRKRQNIYSERNGEGAEDVSLFIMVGGNFPPARRRGFISTGDPELSIPRGNITM